MSIRSKRHQQKAVALTVQWKKTEVTNKNSNINRKPTVKAAAVAASAAAKKRKGTKSTKH